jgi:hypothetical protein
LFCNETATKDRKLVAPDLIGPFQTERNALLICAAIFFVSALPIFWTLRIYDTPFRYLIWIAPLTIVWAERLMTSRAENT